MAFATGYVALSLKGSYVATQDDVLEIDQLKTDFLKRVRPKQTVNFNSIYYSQDQFKLLDPGNSLPRPNITLDDSQFYSSKDCFTSIFSSGTRNFDEKTLLWENFRCGRLSSLPRNFFTASPFIHPSGHSYVYLAYRLGKKNYTHIRWVHRYLPFFHVSELSELRDDFGRLPGIFNLLESMGREALIGIARGKGTILTSRYLFARLNYPRIRNITEYNVYARSDLDDFLKDSSYVLRNYQIGKPCFYRDGRLCWNYNIKHIFQLANTSTFIILFGLILIIVVVVRLLLFKIRAQRLEDEKRRLALRVLTHEFRTPITSLMLTMERLAKKYDQFDEELEDIYLRMSSEVNRLKRLTDTTRNYLKADKSKHLINLNWEKIPSTNDFVNEVATPFLELYPDQIQINYLEKDEQICLDTYWMGICLKNVIENAAAHGEFPVTINLEKKRNAIKIMVVDQGQCQFESLGIMAQEFVKGNKSSGTGLGMNIVKKACKEMGVDIQLTLNPTTMTLGIPLNKARL
jgi:signal transduction histidine kinase